MSELASATRSAPDDATNLIAASAQYSGERAQKLSEPSAPLLAVSAIGVAATLAGCGGADEAQAPLSAQEMASAPLRLDLLPTAPSAQGRSATGRATAPTPTPDQFFAWAEATFPEFFYPRAPATQSGGGQTFRLYIGSQITLSISADSTVFGRGPITNNVAVNLGPLSRFAESVAAHNAIARAGSPQEAARFLQQAQFSSTEAEISAVSTKGFSAWLDEQLAMPLGQTAWDWQVQKGYAVVDINEYFFAQGTYRFSVWYQLFKSPDQLRKRWALALSEIFVVSWRGISDVLNWDSLAMCEYWDLLNRHAFGNYRALLEELTLNPAMGAFLSTRGNLKEDPATGRLPDENYAREVMQLFSIGLHVLNPDGTPKLGANGQPLESYTAQDVSQLARVFTGYNIDTSRPLVSPKPPNTRIPLQATARDPMGFNPAQHSPLEKRFLGVTIPAGTPGPQALKIALDTLANHPNTGPFLARQFIQRMVTSDPSPAYVQRVAAVFDNNGQGVRGDLAATLRAVLLDVEARSPQPQGSRFGRVREPMVRIAQWARTFNVQSKAGTWKTSIGAWNPSSDIHQYPLDPPSVFNFFRPGYVPPGTELAARGATAPEFQIINEATVATWLNLMQSFAGDGFWVQAPELPSLPSQPTPTDGHDIVPDFSRQLVMLSDPPTLIDHLNLTLCAGQMSTATRQLIIDTVRKDYIAPDVNDPSRRYPLGRAIFLVMACADYIVQR